MADTPNEPPAPVVDASDVKEIARGIHVISDNRVPLVPNIGIILGEDAALVLDCGMGPANGQAVLATARALAGDRKLILTLTHFHPEHGFGASAFKGQATIAYNAAQAEELAAKGDAYLGMFRGFGAPVAAALEGTELVAPDETWAGARHTFDLGGRSVEMLGWGKAHTRGDQVAWVPDAKVLFTGDLAENRIFPIFPWFPPDDADIDAANWRKALSEMLDLDPGTVVPGHGESGGGEILQAVVSYLDDVEKRVGTLMAQGQSVDEAADTVTDEMTAAHPDWDAPEWIGFAVRYYAEHR